MSKLSTNQKKEAIVYKLIADIVYKDIIAWNKGTADKSCWPCGGFGNPMWAVSTSFYIISTNQYFEVGSRFYSREDENGHLIGLEPIND